MHRLALALITASALVAGCVGLPLDASTIPDAVPLAFGPALALPLGDGPGAYGLEPSVTADGDGNVIVTAARGVSPFPQSSWLWASHDAGATFRAVPAVSPDGATNLPVGAEGHVDAGPDGVVYFVDLTHTLAVPVARSTDGGESWELRSPSAALVPVGDRPWVAAGPGDAVYVAWNHLPLGQWVLGSTDGGRTFPVQTLIQGTHPAGALVGGPGFSYAAVPDVGPDGHVYLARSDPDGPAVYASRDGAASFERTLAWEAPGRVGFIFTTVAVDDAGTVYVTTVEPVDGSTRVRYAYSTDGARSFSAPREVTSAPGVHAHAWTAAGAPGHYAVAFYESPDAAGMPGDARGEWFVRVAASRNADRPDAAFADARATDGAVHRGPVCTEGLACTGGRELADYLGVDVDPAGVVHATWTDATADPDVRTIRYARTHH